MAFTASRFDALTCSSTCRQRLRRGGEFAYLAGLTKRQQRLQRELHAAIDRHIAAHKESVIATRAHRELKRERRREKQQEELARLELQKIGFAYLMQMQEEKAQWQKKLCGPVAVIKYFVRERRNDLSAQAIHTWMNGHPVCTVEDVAKALELLRAEGHYDRIIAEANAEMEAP